MTDTTSGPVTELAWVTAGDYTLALDGTTIVCRNAKGKELKSIPAKVKKLEEYARLESLSLWLGQHDRTCADTVRGWFLRGETVRSTLISAVWEDPSWRSYIENLVVCAERASQGKVTGLLRDAGADVLRIIDLDGETVEIPVGDTDITVPHPVLIDDIEDWREFIVELGVEQGTDQLFREIQVKPETAQEQRAAVRRYSEAIYSKGLVLIGRSRGAGYSASINEVSTEVMESGTGRVVTVVLEVHCWSPTEDAVLGDVSFRDAGDAMDLSDVGPLAWSEGMRMAHFVYAGRSTDTDADE